jgi:hypothetical protein
MYTPSTNACACFVSSVISDRRRVVSAVGEFGSTPIAIPPTTYDCGWGFLPPSIAWILMTSRCQSRASR